MTLSLAGFSTSVSRLVAAAAPSLTAIRTGPNRHVTGLLCLGNTIVTTDQALPVLDHHTVVLPNGALVAARPGLRDPGANLATLRFKTSLPVVPLVYGSAILGGLVVVLAADADARPTVRLTVIHRFVRGEDGPAPVLDLTAEQLDPGGIALDAEGQLIGLTDIGPNAEVLVIPSAVLSRTLSRPQEDIARAMPTAASGNPPAARGWLGVALQPTTLPSELVTRIGHKSGRMVVRTTAGGPAERGGLRVGDVLLALDGTSTSGPYALRAFLDADRIGSTVEVKLLREGAVLTTQLLVEAQPGGGSA